MQDSLESDRLLAETDWLRGLARSLVDEDSADDLLQETLLVALHRDRTRTGRLRPWLAGIARKLALGRVRARARERRRVERCAVAEPEPGAADAVLEVAARRRVVAAVTALDEPYRSAVLLRFFEGLPPREIATRLRAPVETVRTRLKRGLATLRTGLDAEFGDRETWRRALAAWWGDPDRSASPWWRAGPIALAATTVLTAGGLGWWGGGGGEGAPATPQPQRPRNAWFRIVDPDGRPLDGVFAGLRDVVGSRSAVATQRGGYSAVPPPPRPRELEIRSAGLATAMTTTVPREQSSGVALVVAATARGCRGLVQEADGQPVADAVVRFAVTELVHQRIRRLNPQSFVPRLEASTGAGGQFWLPAVPSFRGARLIARSPDGREGVADVPAEPGVAVVLTLR
ncbi:MAG: RNA polymerase sigma factor [Planctomycetota bacterium]